MEIHQQLQQPSVDYNKKFKELSNKISKIAKESKDNARIQNMYVNQIDEIEQKCLKRFNYLYNCFTQIKNEYTKLTNAYDNNTQYMKTHSQSNQFKHLMQRIQTSLKEQKESLCQYVDSVFDSISNEIINNQNDKDDEKKKLIREASLLQNEVKNKSKELERKIESEKNKIEKVIEDIKKESNDEMELLMKQIEDEDNIKDSNKEMFIKNCKEISDKIDEEFVKERGKREEFEMNIFDLIEETCVKLSETG